MMKMRWLRAFLGIAAILDLAVFPMLTASAAGKEHKLVLHVTENDAKKMNMVLNITQAITKEYKSRGDTIKIEVVANGPGLHMLRADTSPVRKRIGVVQMELDNVKFAACSNTMRTHAKQAGRDIELLPEVDKMVPAVLHIMELQNAGWNYVRP